MGEPHLASDAVHAWEDAYLRFETPDQEVRKFTSRLHALGAGRWSKDAVILDLFCGRGNGLVALEHLGFKNLCGIDLSPRLVRRYSGSGRCVAADCRSLPIRAASQDVAIVQGGLHHLPDVRTDLPLVIAEVQRVLKPGGVFVVVEPSSMTTTSIDGSARRTLATTVPTEVASLKAGITMTAFAAG